MYIFTQQDIYKKRVLLSATRAGVHVSSGKSRPNDWFWEIPVCQLLFQL